MEWTCLETECAHGPTEWPGNLFLPICIQVYTPNCLRTSMSRFLALVVTRISLWHYHRNKGVLANSYIPLSFPSSSDVELQKQKSFFN